MNYSIMGSKSFDYKSSFIEGGETQINLTKNDVKIVVPLNYLSNVWRSLKIPLINYEVELILTWFKNIVLISKAKERIIMGLILLSEKLTVQKMQYLK